MSTDLVPVRQPASESLHPVVYVTMVGLVGWLVLSVLVGFTSSGGITDYLLVIVAGFFFIVVAVPFLLWRVGRWKYIDNPDEPKQDSRSFREWTSSAFGMWHEQTKGINAAAEVLLPIAAVSFGMTAFAIVLHLAVSSS